MWTEPRFFDRLTVGLLVMAALSVAFLAGGPIGVAIYTWVIWTFFHYRYCRQDELVHVLTHAAEAGVPLAAALRAYLHDRSRSNMREFWVATLMFFMLPGYYWIWHRRHSFERKVEDLARKLELGYPLHQALQTTPGVASRETVMAAAMGQATGELARSLRSGAKRRLATIWLEMIPRVVYPVILLVAISAIMGFLMYFIVPKFRRIFMDFGVELPWQTQILLRVSDVAVDYWWAFFPSVCGLLLMPMWIPAMPWYVPGLGAVQRRYLQSHVLDMLGHLLGIGRTVPQALGLIASMPIEQRAIGRLAQAQYCVEQGQQLADSLCAAGLLPLSMVPLLHAAERAGNLPWILAELADSLFKRTARTMQRVMQFVFPTTIVAVGAVVGSVVFAMFIPLIRMISELSLWDRPI